MALEMVIGAGTIPFEAYTSHEFQTGTFPVVNPGLVERTNSFHVHGSWTTQGAVFGIIDPTYHWHGTAIFERMGGAEFSGTFSAIVPYVKTAALQGYSMLINIPGASIPEGVYRVILKLDLHSTAGTAPAVCGFQDLGLVEFYSL